MNKVLKLRLKAAAITLTIATVIPLLVFSLFTNPAFIVWLIMLGVAGLLVFILYLKVFMILMENQQRKERHATRKS